MTDAPASSPQHAGQSDGPLLADWSANRGRPHIQVLLVLFRLSQLSRHGRSARRGPVSLAVGAIYRSVALAVFSIDLPVSTRVGPGLQIHHGVGLVVHSGARIGADVILRQNVTIGSARTGDPAPLLGDGVSVGPNSVVIGDLYIGAGVTIGAGSVVTKSVAPGAVVVGNPARVISQPPVDRSTPPPPATEEI